MFGMEIPGRHTLIHQLSLRSAERWGVFHATPRQLPKNSDQRLTPAGDKHSLDA